MPDPNIRLAQPQVVKTHWLVTMEYLPDKENDMVDALSRDDQPKMVSLKKTPDTSLVAGNFGVPTPT